VTANDACERRPVDAHRGLFLCLEGLDGAGKSTQIHRLAGWLESLGRPVVVCRDPGGTFVGDEIRRVLLDPSSRISPRTEMLLYMASRSQLVDETIRPSLESGSVVVCDRFLLSTIVYQGHAGGLDPEMIRTIGLAAAGGLRPDWTGVLDLPAEVAAQRRAAPADRIERRSIEYHRRVREGFLLEARRDADQTTVFDATQPPEALQERIRSELRRRLGV
jgi:dTMP kinase